MWRIGARVARRIGQAAVALVLATGLSALLGTLAPGRFADDLRLDSGLAPATVAALDRRSTATAAGAVAAWATGLIGGDLGRSFATGGAIAPVLVARTAATCALALPAMILAWAVAWALASGPRPDAARDLPVSTTLLLTLMQSLPDAVVGLLLVRLALVTAWFPVGGTGAESGSYSGGWMRVAWHAVLPIAGLTLVQLPWLTRQIATVLADVRAAPFVQAARARGLSDRGVEWRHVRPAALPRLAPLLGVSLATVPGAALVMEVVFAWPGLGSLLVEAAFARDLPLVLGAVTVSAAVVAIAGGVVDGIRHVTDPRLPS